MTKYITTEDGFVKAVISLQKHGGQLFSGKRPDSAHTWVLGSTVHTFWEPDSKLRKETIKLAKQLELDPTHMTPGRIAKQFLANNCGLAVKHTKFNERWRKAALNGTHWHYNYCCLGDSRWGAELDISGAYMAALLKGDSLLWDEEKGYLDDNGAIDMLRDYKDELPKWFRLILLGVVASHKMDFLIKDDTQALGYRRAEQYKISYGAAFNAVHRAVARLYKLMEKCHQILGGYLIRAHTDSLLIDLNCPESLYQELTDFIVRAGYSYKFKGFGKSHFFDLNTGFIGLKPVGIDEEVKTLMRKQDVRMSETYLPEYHVEQWQHVFQLYMDYKKNRKRDIIAENDNFDMHTLTI